VRGRKISRRALLEGGAKLAAFAAIPAAWRARSCRPSTLTHEVTARVPETGLCASPASRGAARIAPGPPRAPLHPDALESFVDALPIPRAIEAQGRRPDPTAPGRVLPFYRVEMRATDVQVHRDLPPTRMWTYDGTMPGPTFETRSGQGLLVEWVNALPAAHFLPVDPTIHGAGPDQPPVRAVVHVHGAKAPPESDGYPDDWTTPGRSRVAHYPNQQDAATLWYHDHAMGLERLNQYAGLLGCFFVRDDAEDALDLPRGAHEVPLVLCDRFLYADAQLSYPTSGHPDAPWVSEVYGDASLVNGKLRPYLEVEPCAYRLRVVNASNARFFTLKLSDGRAFQQIGTDQGLLPAPVPVPSLIVAPGERADVVVDFATAAGERVLLQNQTVPLVQFRVAAGARAKPRALPRILRPLAPLLAAPATRTRTLVLNEYHDARMHRMLMLLDGKYWHDPVTERPVLGSTEVWDLVNATDDTHPIHLHLVRFQVAHRQLFDADAFQQRGTLRRLGAPVPPPANEAGWKDTVLAEPGAITRIVVRFDGYVGRYVWHCHILEHAANEMMRPFEVVA
jgi:spore coat protein A